MSRLAIPVLLLALCACASRATVNEPRAAACASEMNPPSIDCVSSIGAISERRTVAWETWVACEPPYFDSRGECVTELEHEDREVIVRDTGFLGGMGRGSGGGGSSSAPSSGRGMRGFSPTEDVKGCCADHGGVAGCVTGAVLCRDGAYSPICGC